MGVNKYRNWDYTPGFRNIEIKKEAEFYAQHPQCKQAIIYRHIRTKVFFGNEVVYKEKGFYLMWDKDHWTSPETFNDGDNSRLTHTPHQNHVYKSLYAADLIESDNKFKQSGEHYLAAVFKSQASLQVKLKIARYFFSPRITKHYLIKGFNSPRYGISASSVRDAAARFKVKPKTSPSYYRKKLKLSKADQKLVAKELLKYGDVTTMIKRSLNHKYLFKKLWKLGIYNKLK